MVQAVLLVGFSEAQYNKFKQMMSDMEATMFQIYTAGESEFKSKLCDAFESSGFKPAPLGARRAVILSGMYTSEVCDKPWAYRHLLRSIEFDGTSFPDWSRPWMSMHQHA